MSAALIEQAKKARQLAHAPYSKYRVGAAVRMSDGKVFSGCNVESVSYPCSTCAEYVAIVKAVSEGSTKIAEIAVVTQSTTPAFPCGRCRQLLAEFSSPDTMIYVANLAGKTRQSKFSDLLPGAFTPNDLEPE